jgi:hypothetical protein
MYLKAMAKIFIGRGSIWVFWKGFWAEKKHYVILEDFLSMQFLGAVHNFWNLCNIFTFWGRDFGSGVNVLGTGLLTLYTNLLIYAACSWAHAFWERGYFMIIFYANVLIYSTYSWVAEPTSCDGGLVPSVHIPRSGDLVTPRAAALVWTHRIWRNGLSTK